MRDAWLKCKVENGMFPSELGISFKDNAGQDVSLYCSERFVDSKKSALLVTILEKHDQFARVRLPVQSFSGTTVVEVSAENLREEFQVA
jgi:hypothetical protein